MNAQTTPKYITMSDFINDDVKINYVVFDKSLNTVVIIIKHRENKDIRIKAIMKYTILEGGKWHAYFELLSPKIGWELDSITSNTIKNKLKMVCDPLVTLIYKEIIRRNI